MSVIVESTLRTLGSVACGNSSHHSPLSESAVPAGGFVVISLCTFSCSQISRFMWRKCLQQEKERLDESTS